MKNCLQMQHSRYKLQLCCILSLLLTSWWEQAGAQSHFWKMMKIQGPGDSTLGLGCPLAEILVHIPWGCFSYRWLLNTAVKVLPLSTRLLAACSVRASLDIIFSWSSIKKEKDNIFCLAALSICCTDFPGKSGMEEAWEMGGELFEGRWELCWQQ